MKFRKWILIILAVGAIAPLVASAHSTQMPGETILAQTGGFGPPVLVSPADGGFTRDTRPLFRWITTTDAVSYQLQLSTSAGFTSGVLTFTVSNGTSFRVSTNQPNGIYYWRMRAYNGTLYSDWSEQRQFEIDNVPPLAPVLLAPESGSTFAGTLPTLSWEPVSDAVSYQIFGSRVYGGSFWGIVVAPANSFTLNFTLYPGTYSWYVFASDAAGNSSIENTVWNFTVVSPDDAAPDLYLYGGETNDKVSLRWSAVELASVYHIQVSRDSDFSQLLRDDNTLTAPEVIYSSYTYYDSTRYYWRVRAGQGNDIWGPWSDTSIFIVNQSSLLTRTPGPTATQTPSPPTNTPSPTNMPSPTFTPTNTPSPTATPDG